MLYLISTPIGNLGDFSLRAIETIQLCDYLLCEDTRRTHILLKHYALAKPLKSFHRFSEAKKEYPVLEDLHAGKIIGLLSDAGTPGIADPGARLVARCRLEGVPVCPIPGACAAIVALSASGLNTERFQFLGFLPRKKGKLSQTLQTILLYPGTTICYESPYRIIPTLKILMELDPECFCVIARELTKKFETFLRGTPGDILDQLGGVHPKGECILLIGEATKKRDE